MTRKFDIDEFLTSIFSTIVRKKADKIIEQVALHKTKFLDGEPIVVPLSVIFERNEFTEELIKSTLMAINSKEDLGCHCEVNDDHTFLTIKKINNG